MRRLHRAHATAIPFENLDILLGRKIRIDLADVQEKLLRQHRGGYCFEHNLLLAALLERLDFPVIRLAGRVRMNNSKTLPSTHMTLNVSVDGVTSEQDGRVYGLIEETDRQWVLRSSRSGGWFDLYCFTLEPRHYADYFVVNYYTSTHPRSCERVDRRSCKRYSDTRAIDHSAATPDRHIDGG